MATQCKGKTADDKACKRKTKDASRYCYQHKKQEKQVTLVLPGIDTPLPSKCQTVMRRGASQKDGPGSVYIYKVHRDDREKLSYFKIGRTEREVETRISEWPGAVLVHSYKCKNNRMAERMIHILLNEHRIYRYKYAKGTRYHSIWKKDGSLVQDTQSRGSTWKPPVRGKETEWFIHPLKDCKRIIEAVVAYCDKVKALDST